MEPVVEFFGFQKYFVGYVDDCCSNRLILQRGARFKSCVTILNGGIKSRNIIAIKSKITFSCMR